MFIKEVSPEAQATIEEQSNREHTMVQKSKFMDISKYTITGKVLWDREVEEIPHLVENLIPQCGLAIVSGTGGIGKSGFLRQLGAAIATGEEMFLDYQINPTSRKVIYVSTEDGENATANLLRKQNPSPKDADGLENIYFIHETDSILEKLENCCAQLKPDLIVLDCLADLLGDIDFNATNKIRSVLDKYNDIAKKHNTAIVFIHHVNKSAEKNSPHKNNLLGSVSFGDKVRLVLEFRVDSSNSSLINVSIVKSNYLPNEIKEKVNVYEFKNMTFHSTGISRNKNDMPVKKNTDYLKERVHTEKINNPALSVREIADKLTEQGIPIKKSRVGDILKDYCPEPITSQ